MDEGSLSGPAQQQRVQFLENNLEKITKVYKKLLGEMADLRMEQPKMEALIRGREGRITLLEGALKEIKARAEMEKKKYKSEVEQIKEDYRRRLRKQTPHIVKPIRPGQVFLSHL